MSLNLNLGDYKRRNSIPVKIGDIFIGGSHPIAVQSMTNTDTADISTTFKQIIDLANAGSEIVRVTVDRDDSAKAIPYIKEKLTDLFTLAGLSTKLCSLDKKIKPPEIKNVDKVDEGLKNQAMFIFQDLSTRAHEFTIPNRQNGESLS